MELHRSIPARLIFIAMGSLAGRGECATLLVDGIAGSDSATCGTAPGAAACRTINYAINARAAPGDTILVAAGIYAEQVSIPATLPGLRLNGAQAGIDARSRSGANESILDGAIGALTTGIAVAANDVTIDGFTIQNYNAGGASFGYAIMQYGTTSGGKIINDILRANGYTGLYMGCAGATQCLAQFNLFDSNQAAGNGGDGIYNDTGTNNVLIDSNRFTGQINGSVIITGVPGTTQNNITISNNVSISDGLIGVFGATNVNIVNNSATNPVAGIRVDGSQNVTVTGNAILGGARTAFYAFRASANNGFPNLLDKVSVTRNTFLSSHYGVLLTNNFSNPTDPAQAQGVLLNAASLTLSCNRIVGNAAVGFLNGDDANTSVGATQNWWGCNAGPNATGCDTASGANSNQPWLVLGLRATPNSLTLGSNTRLSASLNEDSSGAIAPCSLPDITPIAFSSATGSITNAANTTSRGEAAATYSPPSAGISSVSATVDNQIVELAIAAAAPSADLSITESGPASAIPGSIIVYNITIANNGNDPAQAVTVSESTPAGLTLISAGGAGCSALPCSVGALASGASINVSVVYQVLSSASGSISAIANVSSITSDPNPLNNTAMATTVITPLADLVAALNLPATALAGATVNGTYTCTNNGPSAASNVSCVISGLPASSTSACTPVSPAASLASGASLSCTYSFETAAAGAVTAVVTASSATGDPTPANDSVSGMTTIIATADMQAEITAPVTATVGSPVAGTYTCRNNGTSAATNASCSIAGLPAGAANSCVPVAPAESLASGASFSCSFAFTPTSLQMFALSISASSSVVDLNPGNDVADILVTITAPLPATHAPMLSWFAQVLLVGLLMLTVKNGRRD